MMIALFRYFKQKIQVLNFNTKNTPYICQSAVHAMQKKSSRIHPILFQLWKKTYASICGFERIKLSNLIRHKATNIDNEQFFKSRMSDHH